MNDRLSASGVFAVTHSEGGSSLLFGWFHHTWRGRRTPNALVFRLDGESRHFRVFFEYGTQSGFAGGGQTFEGAYQTNPASLIPADGKSRTWRLEYDPESAGGLGGILFALDGLEYRVNLEEEHNADSAEFDRFGILNAQIHGDGMKAYFDDLNVDGKSFDFRTDPGWEGFGNCQRFYDVAIGPFHDFGYRPSNFAGKEPGEIGGYVWRIESVEPQQAGYYGVPIGRLPSEDELFADGTLAFRSAGVDSALLIGWFSSLAPVGAPPPNFLGVLVEGPSRVGRYIRAVYGTSDV